MAEKATELPEDTCLECGGTGVDDRECACGDDICCCAVPEYLDCALCGGDGVLPIATSAAIDAALNEEEGE